MLDPITLTVNRICNLFFIFIHIRIANCADYPYSNSIVVPNSNLGAAGGHRKPFSADVSGDEPGSAQVLRGFLGPSPHPV